MVNYRQHLRLLQLVLLLSMLAVSLAQEDQHPEALHRNKRTLTTICVEIKPSGPQEEPYFMCKGTDFSRGNPQAQDQQQPMQNYAQPAGQATPMNGQYAQVPFPSFPSFGAGFFPILPSYDEVPKATPATSYQNQSPAGESHATTYGSSAAPVAFSPAPAAQSYGMPAVPYQSAGGTPAAARGNAAGSGAAATPHSYADAAPQKSPTAAPKAQTPTGPASNPANPYDSIVGSRHRTALADDVLSVPDVGFRHEELRRPMEPMVGAAPPMMWMPLAQTQLQQPTLAPQMPAYHDDPVMRTFYASLEHNEPQVAQAAPMQQSAPMEPQVGQAAPAYSPVYAAAPQAPPAQPAAPVQPLYTSNPRPGSGQSSPADGNACNSCNRACATMDTGSGYNVPSHCPSFQPVIIAMPCYGQQQPTHYLAVPGSGAAAQQREPMVSSAFGAPFGLSPQMGSPFGMASHFGMAAPQVGSAFGMGPQVGAPFGMAPVLNPFGPFGNLNPFNPFNRMLGSAAPTTQQPRLRLFGAPEEATTVATTSPAATQFPQPALKAFTLNFSSSTLAPPRKVTTEPTDATVGAAHDPDGDHKDDDDDDDEDEDENVSHEATESPHSTGTTDDDAATVDSEVSKSLESKDLTAEQLIKKGEDKLKLEKRKRHNSRYSTNGTQKRKYIQRL